MGLPFYVELSKLLFYWKAGFFGGFRLVDHRRNGHALYYDRKQHYGVGHHQDNIA